MNLYHYCSNSAFLSIAASKEILISEFSLSNDAMEGKWIREVISEYCTDKGLTASDRLRLLERLDLLISSIGAAGFCMSEEGDLLSQWRAYADNGAGVSIGFDKEHFELLQERIRNDEKADFGLVIKKIAYDVAEQKKLLSGPLDKILELVSKGAFHSPTLLSSALETEEQKKQRQILARELGMHFFLFLPHFYSLKNPAFSEEREWRLVSVLLKKLADQNLDDLSKMEFRPLKDRIVPYRRVTLDSLPQPSIREIILGPRNITPEEVIEGFLKKSGWKEVVVRHSKASYR